MGKRDIAYTFIYKNSANYRIVVPGTNLMSLEHQANTIVITSLTDKQRELQYSLKN